MAQYLNNKVKEGRVTSTPSNSEYLKAFLETTSERLMRAMEELDGPDNLEFIYKYCTEDYTMECFPDVEVGWPKTNTLEENLAHINTVKQVNPSWTITPYNFTAMLDQEQAHAVVWFTSGPSGGPGGPEDWSSNRESVSRLKWRKRERDGQWECYNHVVVRGGGCFPDLNQTTYAR